MSVELLPPSLRQRLSRLRLRSPRQGPETHQQGPHRGRRRGRSLEFAEHRDYVPGDDLRHLDWNAYARHERLVVKEFESELERTVLVVLDWSASMAPAKRRLALELAAALSWVALGGQDRLALASLGQELRYHPPRRGRSHWGQLIDWLGRARPGGRAQLGDSLQSLCRRLPRSSLVVVLSDWFEPEAARALAFAHYRRHQLAALQLLDREDRDPPWSGAVRLEDVETGEVRRLVVDAASLSAYRERLDGHCQELREQCRLLGFSYHLSQVEAGPEAILLRELVAQGWLR